MRIWNDRIVLPDGTVVMPEQVNRIDLMTHNDNAAILVGDQWLSLNGARIDRCTFLPDSKGVTAFENDRVYDNANVLRGGTIVFSGGSFGIKWDNLKSESPIQSVKYCTITGMVPYSAEAGNAR